jgi:hypothetical protein
MSYHKKSFTIARALVKWEEIEDTTDKSLRMIHADYISTVTRLHTNWRRQNELVLQDLEKAGKMTERARTLLGILHGEH